MTAPVAAAAAKGSAKAGAAKAKSGARQVPLTGTFGDEDTFGPPTASDNAEFKRSARARDKAAAAEYGPDPSSPPGRRPPSSGKRHQFRPANLVRGRSSVPGGTVAEEGAGFLLGLFTYALLVNFLRDGPAGVRAWLAAKFVNKTTAPTTTTHPSMSPTNLHHTPESALHGGATK